MQIDLYQGCGETGQAFGFVCADGRRGLFFDWPTEIVGPVTRAEVATMIESMTPDSEGDSDQRITSRRAAERELRSALRAKGWII